MRQMTKVMNQYFIGENRGETKSASTMGNQLPGMLGKPLIKVHAHVTVHSGGEPVRSAIC